MGAVMRNQTLFYKVIAGHCLEFDQCVFKAL